MDWTKGEANSQRAGCRCPAVWDKICDKFKETLQKSLDDLL